MTEIRTIITKLKIDLNVLRDAIAGRLYSSVREQLSKMRISKQGINSKGLRSKCSLEKLRSTWVREGATSRPTKNLRASDEM